MTSRSTSICLSVRYPEIEFREARFQNFGSTSRICPRPRHLSRCVRAVSCSKSHCVWVSTTHRRLSRFPLKEAGTPLTPHWETGLLVFCLSGNGNDPLVSTAKHLALEPSFVVGRGAGKGASEDSYPSDLSGFP